MEESSAILRFPTKLKVAKTRKARSSTSDMSDDTSDGSRCSDAENPVCGLDSEFPSLPSLSLQRCCSLKSQETSASAIVRPRLVRSWSDTVNNKPTKPSIPSHHESMYSRFCDFPTSWTTSPETKNQKKEKDEFRIWGTPMVVTPGSNLGLNEPEMIIKTPVLDDEKHNRSPVRDLDQDEEDLSSEYSDPCLDLNWNMALERAVSDVEEAASRAACTPLSPPLSPPRVHRLPGIDMETFSLNHEKLVDHWGVPIGDPRSNPFFDPERITVQRVFCEKSPDYIRLLRDRAQESGKKDEPTNRTFRVHRKFRSELDAYCGEVLSMVGLSQMIHNASKKRPFMFCDIGCAPGGLSRAIFTAAKNSPNRVCGFGLSLPVREGGWPMFLDELQNLPNGQNYKFVEGNLLDAADPRQLKAIRTCKKEKYDFVMLNATLDHKLDSLSSLSSGDAMERVYRSKALFVTQFAIAISYLKPGGNLLIRSELCDGSFRIRMLSMLMDVFGCLQSVRPFANAAPEPVYRDTSYFIHCHHFVNHKGAYDRILKYMIEFLELRKDIKGTIENVRHRRPFSNDPIEKILDTKGSRLVNLFHWMWSKYKKKVIADEKARTRKSNEL